MIDYDITDYKEAIRTSMKNRRLQFGPRFTYEKMAAACGVQKTYFSKVMNSHAHLNADQLFSACEYLKLSVKETDFLILLRDLQLTTNSRRSEMLKFKIEKLRKEGLKIKSELSTDSAKTINKNSWEYFSDIDLQLVHIFLTLPLYAKKPDMICEKIGIDKNKLFSILTKLKDWELIHSDGSELKALDPHIHLPDDSPVFLIFSVLKRLKTIEKIKRSRTDENDDYFFSVIFSSEQKFQTILKKKILNFIKETQSLSVKQKSEEVYQLNIDFCKWS
ncbi:MAG: DUF4423 domain-containing protein [Bdellovibrionaceae bacterium]|nr:DUF4423 domain-containing protein [Pseudobdellovibrionaceae bacterium]NUM60140.1 DUF4423 domain-containing protein [Pseudobdellovibrionaceae bacterium]